MLSTSRFTVYDVMESKGTFRDNAANAYSPKFKGPEQYPRMFYHPEGLERVVVPADTQVTPWGPQKLWEQREIINRIANDEQEADELRAAGWHDHPAKALMAAGKEAPAITSADQVHALEAKIRAMEEELKVARAGMATGVDALPGKGVK